MRWACRCAALKLLSRLGAAPSMGSVVPTQRARPCQRIGRALAETGNGTVIELTNATVSKPLREQLRQTACARFSTVLGNGADAYHENHVHIDLMQRTNNYKICQWNILDPTEIAALASKNSVAADISFPGDHPVQWDSGATATPTR